MATRIPRGYETYGSVAGRIADQVGVPRDTFFALIHAESAWNPRAVSPAGAQGLGQLMPGTARSLGVKDPFDPEQNLTGAARYLKQQYETFGDWDLALAAYNSGPGNVKKHKGIPPFAETQAYVPRIRGLRSLYGGSTPAGTPNNPLLTGLPSDKTDNPLLAGLPSAPSRPAPPKQEKARPGWAYADPPATKAATTATNPLLTGLPESRTGGTGAAVATSTQNPLLTGLPGSVSTPPPPATDPNQGKWQAQPPLPGTVNQRPTPGGFLGSILNSIASAGEGIAQTSRGNTEMAVNRATDRTLHGINAFLSEKGRQIGQYGLVDPRRHLPLVTGWGEAGQQFRSAFDADPSKPVPQRFLQNTLGIDPENVPWYLLPVVAGDVLLEASYDPRMGALNVAGPVVAPVVKGAARLVGKGALSAAERVAPGLVARTADQARALGTRALESRAGIAFQDLMEVGPRGADSRLVRKVFADAYEPEIHDLGANVFGMRKLTTGIVDSAKKYTRGKTGNLVAALAKEYVAAGDDLVAQTAVLVKAAERGLETRVKHVALAERIKTFAKENKGQIGAVSYVQRLVRDVLSAGTPEAQEQAVRQARRYGVESEVLGTANYYKDVARRVSQRATEALGLDPKLHAFLDGPPNPKSRAYLGRFFDQSLGKLRASTLGEAGSTAYSGTKSFAARQAAILETAQHLANSNLSAPIGKEGVRRGWVAVPLEAKGEATVHHTLLKRAAKKFMINTEEPVFYGALAGRQVPTHVFKFLNSEVLRTTQSYTAFLKRDELLTPLQSLNQKVWETWMDAVGLTKAVWLSMPKTLIANVLSNHEASALGMRLHGLNPVKLTETAEETTREMLRFRQTQRLSPDMKRIGSAFWNTQTATIGLAGAKSSAVVAGVERAPLGARVGEKLSASLQAQGWSEQWSKLNLFKALTKNGVSEGEAKATVDQVLFDYGTRAPWAEWLDKMGLWPFNHFQIQSRRLLADIAWNRPDLLARYPVLQDLWNKQFGADMSTLPEEERSTFKLAYGKTPDGRPKFLDASRFNPVGEPVKIAEDFWRQGKSGKVPTFVSLSSLASKPVFTAAVANVFLNQKIYPQGEYDRPGRVSHPGQAFWDRVGTHLWELAKSYGPGLLRDAEKIYNTENGRTTNDYAYSEPMTREEAILSALFGLRTTIGETEPQKEARLGPTVTRRNLVSSDLIREVDRVWRENPAANPYRNEFDREKDLKKLQTSILNMTRFLNREAQSGRSVDARGKLTPAGRRSITKTVQRLQAAVERADALARQ